MTMQTGSPDRAAGGARERMTQAWQWLCEQRTRAPEQADIWHIRWENLNADEGRLKELADRVLRGDYRLTPLQLHGKHEHRKAVWSAQDALVLKWAELSLQHQLPLHPSCEHIKGYGGGKQAIEKLHGLLITHANLSEKKTDDSNARRYSWVCRTDIRGYYRNINKQTLLKQVRQYVICPVLVDLVQQYIHYTVEDGGTFHTPEKGISRGCPLSPLMGVLHLYDMDEHFSQQQDIHYARYMDDVIILAKTRWQLRKHTKRLMQWFGAFGFEAHPDKTHIGRTEKRFDWMGAWLTHEGVTDIAPRAKANHREKVRQLYEQLARLPKWKRKSVAPKVNAWVSAYRKRWNIWAERTAGVSIAPPAYNYCTSSWLVVTALATSSLWCLSASASTGSGCSPTAGASTSVGTILCTFALPEGYVNTVIGSSAGAAGWIESGDDAAIDSGNASSVIGGYTVVSTTAGRKCGVGIALLPGSYNDSNVTKGVQYNATGGSVTSSAQVIGCKENRGGQCAPKTVSISGKIVSLGPAPSTCPAGTVVGRVCTYTYSNMATTPLTGAPWSPSSTLYKSCGTGNSDYFIDLGAPYTPPVAPICSINVINGTPNMTTVDPVSGPSAKGTVIGTGDTVSITSSCSTSGKPTAASTKLGAYSSIGPDYNSAGYDRPTNTYVGLVNSTSPKAAVGANVADADLWTSTPSSSSPQTTDLKPIVIRGSTPPNIGSASVTVTVTSVAP